MAMEEDDNEETVIETNRLSLLEVIEDRNRSQSKKTLIHRVFFISKIAEEAINNRTSIGGYFEQFMKHLRTDFQSEAITGLMLIYMKHIVHVMECSADMILKMAKELIDHDWSKTPVVSSSKILVISHDIPHRQYQSWNFRNIDIVEPGLEAYEATDTIENLTVDLIIQLLQLGQFLYKQPKLNVKYVMDALHDRCPELLPQQAVVHCLLEQNDPCMMTPEEYVDIYQVPFDVVLDSDLVWPLPTRLFPYN